MALGQRLSSRARGALRYRLRVPGSLGRHYIFHGLEHLKTAYGEERSKKIEASVLAFPTRLKKLAPTIPNSSNGRFPLIYSNFALWKVVVDDDYKVLEVIDWESAHSGQLEIIHFPTRFIPSPSPMVPSDWYDDDGIPVRQGLKEGLEEVKKYIDVVQRVERAQGLSPTLSAVLGDWAGQDLAHALHLDVEDVYGHYSTILDIHHGRWCRGNKDSEAA